MTFESIITCPHCATAKAEIMPTDACRFFYSCTGCAARLRPKDGDCCVFCSYGSVPCPPVQAERSGEAPAVPGCTGWRMAEASIQSAGDWVGRPIGSLLAWWVPHAAMLAAFLFPVPARAGVWTIALSWMAWRAS
jgi:hypothetical protein